ncbi:Holliday junction ATP-dependent DNA helicase RuvA [Planctomycetes bacterium Pan216]|uniref:Holliday junction branch migration complex subunit RuvA n=1 Tax=Kolteria novifilia TaxID=2527975 RepID=A0A518B4A9_9BACT|nr:Holliday junction ATP-dependent DNA helicase RuvA [Planctomycetes bacterium Pan216]
MITSIRGTLVRVLEEEARIAADHFEYQVLLSDWSRRSVQMNLGEDVVLHTIEYLEGDPRRGRLTPRLVGFLSEPEKEFFELLCTVDGIGVRKALSAINRPIRDVAGMIHHQDLDLLSTLPGVSKSTAERIVAKLRKKVAKFALMVERVDVPKESGATQDVIETAYLALVSVGHPEADARKEIDRVLAGGKKFRTAEEILSTVYERS